MVQQHPASIVKGQSVLRPAHHSRPWGAETIPVIVKNVWMDIHYSNQRLSMFQYMWQLIRTNPFTQLLLKICHCCPVPERKIKTRPWKCGLKTDPGIYHVKRWQNHFTVNKEQIQIHLRGHLKTCSCSAPAADMAACEHTAVCQAARGGCSSQATAELPWASRGNGAGRIRLCMQRRRRCVLFIRFFGRHIRYDSARWSEHNKKSPAGTLIPDSIKFCR